MREMNSRITAVVGLGNMGWPVASQLHKTEDLLYVADLNQNLVSKFIAEHEGSEPVSDRWHEVSRVITVLPNSAIVKSFVQGIIGKLPQGALIIDTSSSDPFETRKLKQTVESHGIRLVDAPVSGGVANAEKGTLAVMLGGSPDDVREAELVLEPVAKKFVHVGETGAGHAAKALNNMVSAGALSLTVEALKIAQKFGIEPEAMLDVLNNSSGRTNTSENKVMQFMLSGTFAAGFSQHLMTKDLKTAVSIAKNLNENLQVGSVVEEQWSAIAETVDGEADHTEMYRFI